MYEPAPDPGDRPDGPTLRRGRGSEPSSLRNAVEWVAIIVAALAVALVVKTFLFQVFLIPSDSMVPQLQVNDRVLVNKLSDGLDDVERGDLIVFKRPPSAMPSEIEDLIKRVVATGGETVSAEGGRILVDGVALDEDYLPEGVITSDLEPQLVPPGHLWVMGDNRTRSQDSRFFGPISEDLIVGRAFLKLWPPQDISTL